MRNTITPYISLFFLLLIVSQLSSQQHELSISSITASENAFLQKIDFSQKHKDSLSALNEVEKISNYLKTIGYFTNTIDSIVSQKKRTIAFYSLNERTEEAVLYVAKNYQLYFKDSKIKNDTIRILIKNLKPTLNNVSQKLDDDGKSFSKIQLKNITIKNKKLFAEINIRESKKRYIDKVVVKGYEKFPKSFLKHYLKLEEKNVFTQKKITEISILSKNLGFVNEIKPPEILFTKDSTLVYLYVKKQQNNSFDGIINFASNEKGGILFNGNLNLTLNNIVNTGERFSLFWNSIANERQEFQLSTTIPYIFNSKITPEFTFNLYKQDSTFLNTKFDTKILYNLNIRNSLALTYSSETSLELEETFNNDVNSYKNFFLGFLYRYRKKSNNLLLGDKFFAEINPAFGSRTINTREQQLKIKATFSYLLSINRRNYLYIKNSSGYLDSDNFVTNELFRIGGVNSLRGFNEQEFFTNRYNYTNLEYRYLLSETSLFYTITDIGFLKNGNDKLIGLGLGYQFINEKFLVNIGIAIGDDNENQFKATNSKILLKWVGFF